MEFVREMLQGYNLPDITYKLAIAGILAAVIIIFLLSLLSLKLKRWGYNAGYYIRRSTIIILIIFVIVIFMLVILGYLLKY